MAVMKRLYEKIEEMLLEGKTVKRIQKELNCPISFIYDVFLDLLHRDLL